MPENHQAVADQHNGADNAQDDLKPRVRREHRTDPRDREQDPASDPADDTSPDQEGVATAIRRPGSQHGNEVRTRRGDRNRPGAE